jgi:hypothetical protein
MFVPHQSGIVLNEKPTCYYDKATKTSLQIMNAKEFILIDEQILLGTKYLSMEKGHVEQTQTGKLTFVISSVAMLDANKIDLTKVEDISGGLRTYGELSNDGIKLSSKGLILKRCSCNKRVFKILKSITAQ